MPAKKRAASRAKTDTAQSKKHKMNYELDDVEIELDKRIDEMRSSAKRQAQRITNTLNVHLVKLPKSVREMSVQEFMENHEGKIEVVVARDKGRMLNDSTNTVAKKTGAQSRFCSTVVKNKTTSSRVGRTLGTIKKAKGTISKTQQQQPKTPSFKTMKSAKTPAFHPGLPKTPSTKTENGRRATVRATFGADESGDAAIIEFERSDGSKFNLTGDTAMSSNLSTEERENALAQIESLRSQLDSAAAMLQ